MLVGIVLRGSAFTFRTYDTEHDAAQRRWGRIFASASVVTPILLGVSHRGGRLRPGRRTAGGRRSPSGSWRPGSRRSPSRSGLLTLALFAFLAAVFLTLESHDSELCEDFRRRALGAGVAVFLTPRSCCCSRHGRGPADVRAGSLGSAWALPLHLRTGAAAIAVLVALWFRRYRLARVGAGLQVSLIFWGWPLAQYPYLLPPGLPSRRRPPRRSRSAWR